MELPIDGIGLDFVYDTENRNLLHQHGFASDKILIAGVVDGRNVWRNNLPVTLDLLDDITTVVSRERLITAPSCSLLHVPYDATRESEITSEVRPWLAFAEQKLEEVVTLSRAVHEGRDAVATELEESQVVVQSRARSPLVHDAHVQDKLASWHETKRTPYAERRKIQSKYLNLPLLPTTTIGSFPQTAEVRLMRRRFETSEISAQEYEHFIEQSIAEIITRQEKLGIDVLVHGEFERNDMVQYFGEQLSGFAFTHYGWVQSYGSRCVRPPILYGDVARPKPMTVRWSTYAQSLTDKPVKGMLTGPVTMLNWSFVRNDQSREMTCRQIALALSEEVADLERAGLQVIQVDEPALREGLPLRHSQWNVYLTWATACFRLVASGAGAATQIHTHMCYSAFNDIIDAIATLDADVISLENSRSGGELLEVFRQSSYEKEIGPGVYDIHSPRIPDIDEIKAILQETLQVLPVANVWVNPDCGLKTRTWEEVIPALEHMVEAARQVRSTLSLQVGGSRF
jgi:5-methyltetrahydropteroyltriglutamate--homocysteine methyltransferase